ncbi:Glycine betaine/carnitine/choline transport system permease protein OpuCB [Arthrobacter ulcerisalmonis]|uniref:Glycine betaine/carnitine/choline transport system permease protein OpuCB n=1 Tax=Arthrobacter ulcerisalmonis TaxID=2483813 RepID=A0A3P5X803_9MICC|nr:ABC transporter permease [Arthrobacter ulcerisalmonis]VDC26929.1 Glycine betaine/carnitine/choline transport system permease protein OpuCB [Arthrobacter ulcerisalmonis]
MSNVFVDTYDWLADPTHWTGSTGIPTRMVEHLQYTGLVMLIAVVIAVPIGLYVGHTGRGRVAVVSIAGALRALPTLGLLTLFVLLAGIGLMPPVWALVILTVPPLLAGTYAGISSVDRNVVDAARAMGMTELQVLFRAELPNALTVMFGGFRTGVLQVIATVSVVAYINLGGLGRYVFDGLVLSDFPQMLGGSLLIAVLAIAVDLVLSLIQRLFLNPGAANQNLRSQQAAGDLTDSVAADPVIPGGKS